MTAAEAHAALEAARRKVYAAVPVFEEAERNLKAAQREMYAAMAEWKAAHAWEAFVGSRRPADSL